MTEPQIASARTYQALTVHLTWKPFGWAVVTIDDDTGTLLINSDWCNCSHRWGRGPHLGVESQKLSDFIRQHFDANYLARKLFYGKKVEAYDERETERAVRTEIIRMRRDERLDRERARELWNSLKFVEWASADMFVMSLPDDVSREVCGGEPWYWVGTRTTSEFIAIQDIVLPALRDALNGAAR